MISQFDKPNGYMKIQAYDAQNSLIDTYEDCNLVMNTARNSMQLLQAGVTAGQNIQHPIDAFRLGTQGVQAIGGVKDHGQPKVPGTAQGEYHPEMDGLFSQDDTTGDYVFEAIFNSISGGLDETFGSSEEKIYFKDSEVTPYESSGCTLKRTVIDRVITFEITVPMEAANPPGTSGLSLLEYSEQALYCGDRIFSMKTFPTKFKTGQVKLVITWSIIF